MKSCQVIVPKNAIPRPVLLRNIIGPHRQDNGNVATCIGRTLRYLHIVGNQVRHALLVRLCTKAGASLLWLNWMNLPL